MHVTSRILAEIEELKKTAEEVKQSIEQSRTRMEESKKRLQEVFSPFIYLFILLFGKLENTRKYGNKTYEIV